MRILAIDPGPRESAVSLIDAATRRPLFTSKESNGAVLDHVAKPSYDYLCIEMIASYGMPVGADVFKTCVWVGRFQQHAIERRTDDGLGGVDLQPRQPVKLHHCHSAKAKDSNVIQALIDRFAPGETNRGKGTKASPGWFYGFAADMWQAYALAVYLADQMHPDVVAVDPAEFGVLL